MTISNLCSVSANTIFLWKSNEVEKKMDGKEDVSIMIFPLDISIMHFFSFISLNYQKMMRKLWFEKYISIRYCVWINQHICRAGAKSFTIWFSFVNETLKIFYDTLKTIQNLPALPRDALQEFLIKIQTKFSSYSQLIAYLIANIGTMQKYKYFLEVHNPAPQLNFNQIREIFNGCNISKCYPQTLAHL